MSALLFIAVLLVSASTFMIRSEPASAHFQSGEWSHDTWLCDYNTTRQDPVSLIFYDWGYADRSNDSVKFHMGWPDGNGGQYFASHGNCLETTRAAQNNGDPNQYHIRIKKTTETDGNPYGVTSASTPHFERWCDPDAFFSSHGVFPNGFAEGREHIINNIYWREGHGWGGYQWWGNTSPREPECQDNSDPNDPPWWAFGDGNVGWLVQHYSFHQ